jgi:hypothetical protein
VRLSVGAKNWHATSICVLLASVPVVGGEERRAWLCSGTKKPGYPAKYIGGAWLELGAIIFYDLLRATNQSRNTHARPLTDFAIEMLRVSLCARPGGRSGRGSERLDGRVFAPDGEDGVAASSENFQGDRFSGEAIHTHQTPLRRKPA